MNWAAAAAYFDHNKLTLATDDAQRNPRGSSQSALGPSRRLSPSIHHQFPKFPRKKMLNQVTPILALRRVLRERLGAKSAALGAPKYSAERQ